MIKVEDYREFYNLYFKEFNRLAVGEFADLSYGKDTPNDTASSLESVVAYANYILKQEQGELSYILNAGAGASSWIFRKLFADGFFKMDILCCDPNEKFLKFVEHIITENGLPVDDEMSGFRHGMVMDLFEYQTNITFDHVYFDYGNIERLPYIGAAIDLAEKSIYVDDVDKRQCCYDYRDITIKLCEAMGLKWFDCDEALDSYERAGIIIEK